MKKMPYYVGQPGHRGGFVAGRPAAIRLATSIARRTGRIAHIHAVAAGPQRRATKGRLLAIVSPRGAVELHEGLYGMGDTLTDWACDSSAFAASWRKRLDEALDSAGTAALIGGTAAGLLGALVGRPALGAGVGALAGWAASAIWTAPHRPPE